jgi:hypothetical protein
MAKQHVLPQAIANNDAGTRYLLSKNIYLADEEGAGQMRLISVEKITCHSRITLQEEDKSRWLPEGRVRIWS